MLGVPLPPKKPESIVNKYVNKVIKILPEEIQNVINSMTLKPTLNINMTNLDDLTYKAEIYLGSNK